MFYFSTLLYAKTQGYSHFTFTCVLTNGIKKYQVSALSRSLKQSHFMMEERYGNWVITEAPRPPDWIFELENRLADVINSYQHNDGAFTGPYRSRVEGSSLTVSHMLQLL
jgi:hypothetical protein